MKKTILLLFSVLLPLLASADAVEIDGIYYNLVSKAKLAEVTNNPDMYSGDIDIPETVVYEGNSYNVKTIADGVFMGCSELTSVVMPNSITTIGENAFRNCENLVTVTFGNGVTKIGNNAFWGCSSLLSAELPNSVTTIGERVFQDCYKLQFATLPNSLTSIPNLSFYDCRSLYSIDIPNSVTEIGYYAFNGCSSLSNLTIGNSVRKIGQYAFAGCNSLPDIEIPNSVTEIENHAFSYCTNFYSIVIPNSVTLIAENVFENCSRLKSVTLSNNISVISGECFRDCGNLTSIEIPEGVERVALRAFENCTKLPSIKLPKSLNFIAFWAFKGCTSLTSIDIPDNVTMLEKEAFNGCSKLEKVYIGSGVATINQLVFANCSELTDVYCSALSVPKIVDFYMPDGPAPVDEVFKYSYIEYATLHIPYSSLSDYSAAEPWKSFGTIRPTAFLDENVTTDLSAATDVDVVLKRNIKANEWSTICLPFTMTEAQVKTAFGNDVELADFNGYDTEESTGGDIVGINVKFETATSIEANHPYIIKVKDAVNSLEVASMELIPESMPIVSKGKGKMCGNYTASKTLDNGTLFLSDNEFWYSKGSTKMKAYRAYFDFPDVLTSVESSSSRIVMTYDNEITGIESLNNNANHNDTHYYDLQGRRIVKPGKGIYVKDGKKVIVK